LAYIWNLTLSKQLKISDCVFFENKRPTFAPQTNFLKTMDEGPASTFINLI